MTELKKIHLRPDGSLKMSKATLFLTVLCLCLAPVLVEGVARRGRRLGPEYRMKNDTDANETRKVVKLNRPRWNQHDKWIESPQVSPGGEYHLEALDTGVFVETPPSNESNVCEREEVDVKPGNGKHFYVLSCHRGRVLGKCTKIVGDGNSTKTTTTHYECCPGFETGPFSDACDLRISDKNLREALTEEGRGEFVTAFDSFNLTSAYLENADGQFTVFAPTNESLNAFQASLENINEIENYVEITPDLVETARHIRGRLVSHVVPGVVRDVSPFTTLKLRTAHRDAVIFVKKEFPTEKGSIGITANCIPVTSSERVSNGIIYNIDGFLQSSELGFKELLATRDDVRTFQSLLERANLSALDGNDTTLTVFVPTDEAFEKNPALLRRINGLSPDCLRDLLLNHVFVDFNCASEGSTMRSLTNEDKVITRGDDGKFKVGEAATIVERDVVTGQGLVHFVDSVLVPTTILSAPELSKAAGATKFGEMLESLEFEPSDDASFTLIIPSDRAIEDYKKGKKGEETMTDSELVDFHTVPGAGSMIDKSAARTAYGNRSMLLELSRTGFSLKLTAQCVPVHRIRRYHQTCHFQAFFTDKVLEPAGGNLLELISDEDDLAKFRSIIKFADMEGVFQSDESIITVFGPTDKQIEKLPEDVKNKLAKDKEFAKNFVLMHVADDLHCLPDGLAVIKNRMGETLRLYQRGVGRIPVVSGKTDLVATNGVLHQIHGALRPSPKHRSPFSPSFVRFESPFNVWRPFLRICWSNDDDEICEEFKKK